MFGATSERIKEACNDLQDAINEAMEKRNRLQNDYLIMLAEEKKAKEDVLDASVGTALEGFADAANEIKESTNALIEAIGGAVQSLAESIISA
jgi:hypothetical protein